MERRRDFSGAETEPERYELGEAPPYRFDLDRRNFAQILGGGLVVVLSAPKVLSQESGDRRRRRSAPQMPDEVSAWLHVSPEGNLTVFTGKVEVGQDIRTSLTQVVAEELRMPIHQIQLIMGDTDRTPYDRGTFGSRTTPVMALQLRKVAATARASLLSLAAEHWDTSEDGLEIEQGKVIDPSGQHEIAFGDLLSGQSFTQTVVETVSLKPARDWKIAGQPIQKVNGRSFLTGHHHYTSDLRVDGMWYGKVLRPPSFGAKLKTANTERAAALEGVVVVRDGSFIGVAAQTLGQAIEAVEKIESEWQTSPQPSSDELVDYFKSNPREGSGFGGSRSWSEGSVPDGLKAAETRLEATYKVAYIAHVPLEPRAALAEWKNGRLTVFTGTQRPFGVRSELAEAFRLSEEQVRVLMPDTGSGYGGKHTGEAAVEAARLAKAAGRPVRLVWTREEEFTWAYFRPAGLIEVRSGVDRDGLVTAWEFHNLNSGASGIQGRYTFPNHQIEFQATESPLRQGSYRALASTANHFARESHLDELAHAVKEDPLDFRLKNLVDDRQRAVLTEVANDFGWRERKRTKNRGFGIAAGFEKGSYVANCVEVSIRDKGRIRIEKVVTAFECGAILNPDHLKSQVEGSVIMGLGGALFEAIHFRDGKIANAALSKYRVPRFQDVPKMNTILMNRTDLASAGAGETPIITIAPALANAIFDATGVRLRSLPLVPSGAVGQLA